MHPRSICRHCGHTFQPLRRSAFLCGKPCRIAWRSLVARIDRETPVDLWNPDNHQRTRADALALALTEIRQNGKEKMS